MEVFVKKIVLCVCGKYLILENGDTVERDGEKGPERTQLGLYYFVSINVIVR